MMFLYQCVNENKQIILITKHLKDINETLEALKIDINFIEMSKCNDGHGGEGFYQTFKNAASAKEVEDMILKVKMEDTSKIGRASCRERV